MKEIKYYLAEDGTKFDDEYDCKEYEMKIMSNAYERVLEMYDKDGNKYDMSKMKEIDYNYVDVVVIKSEEAYDYLYDTLAIYYGIMIPSYKDVEEEDFNCAFYYDYDDDIWYSCKKKIEEHKAEIEKLSKYVVK